MEGVALTGAVDSAAVVSLTSSRGKLPFRAVNRRAMPGYLPGMQRHHLLPRQLLKLDCFGSLFANLGREAIGFDDFRTNGLLLPSSEKAALRTGMPLHCGPHRQYNNVVKQRVGQVEASWATGRASSPESARLEALMRLRLLQRALRRRLLERERRSLFLSRKDPFRAGQDFGELDALAESLWKATETP